LERRNKSDMQKTVQQSWVSCRYWKDRGKSFYLRIKSLQGDPHYVAVGMAVGVFVAFTPTIPFHTALSIALAFFLRGSKPAAIIGSWINNPLTFPAFYYGSYKVGAFLLGHDIPVQFQYNDIKMLMTLGRDVVVAMVAGGALLGILPAIGAYFLTLHLFCKIRSRRSAKAESAQGAVSNPKNDGMNHTSRSGNDKKDHP
jgi:uncharacterized protein